jgi:hypothetical protein
VTDFRLSEPENPYDVLYGSAFVLVRRGNVMTITKKTVVGALAVAAALALTAGAAFADHFIGTWKVKDTAGKDFQIVVAKDGTASADRSGEGLSGKWTEEGDAVVITWESGWKTKIAKDGDAYKKTAYEGDAEKGSSAAEKVK